MPADAETLIAENLAPSWLPPGSIAQVIRAAGPLEPMCLVRVLLCRDGEVFCVPRDGSAKLDLPTRSTSPGDATGVETVRALAREVSGQRAHATFVGAVRNVVPTPSVDYPFPTPHAHFGVWASTSPPIIAGEWVSVEAPGSLLAERHWFPLVTDLIARDTSLA